MVEQKSVLSRILIFIIGQFQWNEIIKYLQQGRRKVWNSGGASSTGWG